MCVRARARPRVTWTGGPAAMRPGSPCSCVCAESARELRTRGGAGDLRCLPPRPRCSLTRRRRAQVWLGGERVRACCRPRPSGHARVDPGSEALCGCASPRAPPLPRGPWRGPVRSAEPLRVLRPVNGGEQRLPGPPGPGRSGRCCPRRYRVPGESHGFVAFAAFAAGSVPPGDYLPG